MRQRIYRTIQVSDISDTTGKVYDTLMAITIIISLLPLAMKEPPAAFRSIELVIAGIFAVDYLLRWLTADYELKRGGISFILYPITPMAVCDLLSILPFVLLFRSGFRAFRVFRVIRLIRIFWVFRLIRVLRHSRSLRLLIEVFRKQWDSFLAVAMIAIIYVLISALVMFNVEPDIFDDYFDAVYWAAITLTTVGYGDIYPTTAVGKVVTLVSSVAGIAIIALPAGIIASGILEELEK